LHQDADAEASKEALPQSSVPWPDNVQYRNFKDLGEEHLSSAFKHLVRQNFLDVSGMLDAANSSAHRTMQMQVNVGAAIRIKLDQLQPVLRQEAEQAANPQAAEQAANGSAQAAQAVDPASGKNDRLLLQRQLCIRACAIENR
jgi:hypothetical protein